MHGTKDIIREVATLPVEKRAIIVDSLLRTLNPPLSYQPIFIWCGL